MIKLIYIAGCTHSGSTLLHRVLGSHSRVFTIGGSKHVRSFSKGRINCSCGADTVAACDFWSKVNQHLIRSNRSLAELSLEEINSSVFKTDNLHFYKAIQDTSGKEVIVDTSRNKTRLRQLQSINEIDLLTIHLFKSPLRQVSSWKKKDTPFFRSIKQYWNVDRRIDRLSRNSPNYFYLSYEAFCRDPAYFLSEILKVHELQFESSILSSWGKNRIHVLGGNRMLRKSNSAIYLDDSYKKSLNSIETFLTYLSCTLYYRCLQQKASRHLSS